MLTTVEAEIDVNGKVELLEPLHLKKRTRAIVTLLNEANEGAENEGNSQKVLEFLKDNRLPGSSRLTDKEIGDQILENRDSWD